jgi:hypothetical protein
MMRGDLQTEPRARRGRAHLIFLAIFACVALLGLLWLLLPLRFL